jgi:hypothetical protein
MDGLCSDGSMVTLTLSLSSHSLTHSQSLASLSSQTLR